MKKLLICVLIFALCLSLVACGSSDKYEDIIACLDDEDYSGAIALIQQMAAEDNGQLNIEIMDDVFSGDNGEVSDEVDQEKEALYNQCVEFLNNWAENGNATFYKEGAALSGQEAFLYMYDQLQTISDYKDANEYLKKMLLVENVLLEVKGERVDNMGNTTGFDGLKLSYDEKGRVNYVANWSEGRGQYGEESFSVIYDDAGNAVQLRSGNESHTEAVITRQLDERGRCKKEIIKNNEGEFTVTYKYDKAGRVTQWRRQWNLEDTEAIFKEYTYDKAGRVKTLKRYLGQKNGENSWTEEEISKYVYTYDKDGNLSKVEYKGEYYSVREQNVIEYTVDESGRTLTKKTTYGKRTFQGEEEKPQYASQTENYIYGIYFIYNP